MKKYLFSLCALTVLCSALVANAEESPNLYLSGKLGVALTSDADLKDSGISGEATLDPAFALSGAVGARITPHLRTEVELSYREPDIDKVTYDGFVSGKPNGTLRTIGVMLNGYYDFLPEETFSPFLSVGLGILHHRQKIKENSDFFASKDSEVEFGYQVGGGVGWNVSRRVTIDLGYRYLGSTDPNFDGQKTEYGAHEFMGGVRLNF